MTIIAGRGTPNTQHNNIINDLFIDISCNLNEEFIELEKIENILKICKHQIDEDIRNLTNETLCICPNKNDACNKDNSFINRNYDEIKRGESKNKITSSFKMYNKISVNKKNSKTNNHESKSCRNSNSSYTSQIKIGKVL